MESAACRFFQTENGCFRGDSCTYKHQYTASVSTSASALIPPLPPRAAYQYEETKDSNVKPINTQGLKHCRFFETSAGCRNGSSCPFAHVNIGALEISTSSGGGHATTDFTSHDTSASPQGTPGTRRVQVHSNPQKLRAKFEIISEITPVYTRDIKGPFFAIDVECVATGTGTTDRDVARIAVVDENEELFFDHYVMPKKEIVSYLTQLTGITGRDLIGAPPLEEVLQKLRAILPADSVIVGQSIKKDLTWLGLEKDVDFKGWFDVADLFRIPMQANGSIRYRYFSLRHVAKYLLGLDIQEADHDPIIDAQVAMKVFKQFRYLHETPPHRDAVYQTLLKTPRTPSFAERYPILDGVMMRAPKNPMPPAPPPSMK